MDKEYKQANMASMGIATVLSSMILAGFLLGYLADYWLGTMPIFLLLFGLMGFIGGLIRVKNLMLLADKHSKHSDKKS